MTTTPEELAFAVEHGDLSDIEAALADGAHPDVAGASGITPLYCACAKRDVSVVQLLLARGADPNAASTLGRTPMHGAAVHGDPDTMLALVRAGARLDDETTDGRRPANMTPSLNRLYPLLALGADLRAVELEDEFLQAEMQRSRLEAAVLAGHPAILLYVLEQEPGRSTQELQAALALGRSTRNAKAVIDLLTSWSSRTTAWRII